MSSDARPWAVVSGAARGLGRAVALELAGRGFALALLDRDAAGLAEVVALITGAGGRAVAHEVDVADRSAVEAIGARVCDGRAVEAVVAVAGVTAAAPFVSQPPAELERVVAVNLLGTVNLARAFLPALLARRRGRLVLVSSALVALGAPWQAAYAASKAAVAALGDALWLELRGCGVSVTTVFPGLVRTGIIAAAPFAAPAWRARLDALLQRAGREPAVVARAAWRAATLGRRQAWLGWDAWLVRLVALVPGARALVAHLFARWRRDAGVG